MQVFKADVDQLWCRRGMYLEYPYCCTHFGNRHLVLHFTCSVTMTTFGINNATTWSRMHFCGYVGHDYIYLHALYFVLFSSRVRVTVMVRFRLDLVFLLVVMHMYL